eukprot:TRINITY_DN49625_c0_g1_i1.p1 TRINITY_DN49625_c0_g1~~TRINITY_DN49625_c0_g1_i1.p1  ORF type:complete len:446 (-),score=103.91 TRINITY_DN49625_c0_g1_i1:103-1326(-)
MAAMGYRGRPQVVGIDLGTTFSVVALKSDKGVSIIPDHVTGRQLLPSVVTHFPNGSVLVGDAAVELRGTYSDSTIFNAKRFMGKAFGEVALEASQHPFRVSANFTDNSREASATNTSAEVGFVIASDANVRGTSERWVSPIDVGAAVVRHMRMSVSRHIGYDIHRAVICVPAKFSAVETQATVKAFEQAGFKVMRILEEPTAAAVAYNLHKGKGVKHVLVYDLGGGTLDVSLLYMNGKSVSVLGVAGDDHLGGSDFDHALSALLGSKFANAKATSAKDDQASVKEKCDSIGLGILAEAVKIRLSSALETEARCTDKDGFVRTMVVSRAQYEEAAKELFARSIAPVEKVLADQMMTSDDVHDIVLVGGSSRTPKIREQLRKFFGPEKKLHTDIDPDITVAWGAASILD